MLFSVARTYGVNCWTIKVMLQYNLSHSIYHNQYRHTKMSNQMNSAVGDIWRMYMNKSLAGFNGLFTIEWDTRHITVMDRWVVVRAGLTYRLSKLQFYYICFKIFLFLDNLITSVNSESIPQAHTQAFSGEVTWFC